MGASIRASLRRLVAASVLGVMAAPARAQPPPPAEPRAVPRAADAPAASDTVSPGAAASGDERELAESLRVLRVQFRGNRRVEDDALKVNLRTVPGAALTQDLLRDDVRAIWKMGYFEDVKVEMTSSRDGAVVVFVVSEKPSIRKIYVSGHDEVGLGKINEVLDVKREDVLDMAKVKKNVEKIREVFVQKGHYLCEVDHEVRRVSTAEVDVYFRVRPNARIQVRAIDFTGNQGATDDELRAVMMTQPGDVLSFATSSGTYREDMFQRDLLLLQSYYFDRGYIAAKIGEPLLALSPDRRSLYITLSVDEGLQYRVGTIDVTGDLLEDKATHLALIQTKSGDVFNRSKLQQDVQALTDLYKNRGYAYVNAVPSHTLDEEKRILSLVFEVQRGSEVSFSRIGIRGNTKTRDKVIRREMRIVEGDRYNQERLDTSKRRVNALGYFERVDLSTSRGATDADMEVNVEVSERQTGAFQIGAGFSSYESFIGQAQIQQLNLLGRGQSLTLQAQVSGLRQLFMLQFEEPYFLDTNWTFGFNLFNQVGYYYSFTRSAVGGALTWGYMLHDDVRMFLTYTLQDVGVSTSGRSGLYFGGQRSPIPEGSLNNLLRSGTTSSVRVLIAHDTRDNRLFTRSGWYNTASAEFAEEAILSENTFTRYEAVARYFYPLWGPFVLRLKGDLGLVTSRDPRGVPITERYFVGGIFDVRGYSLRSLGPRIRAPSTQSPDALLQSYPIGGNLQVVTKAEIEFPIVEKIGIRAAVFVDAGNAYNLEGQYCGLRPADVHVSRDPCVALFPLSSLRSSWGFGFRWFSPIGPLRFEWGIPFRTLPGEDSPVFEFTIGNDL